MQILKLVLENAKSYESSQFTFTPGTNAIVGANGAGKSTIVEAIGFALFDSITYRHSDFVREGAKSATVTVSVVSDLDERCYDIVRRCGSSNQYYVYDPEIKGKICEGKNDVLSFLKEHMKVDPTADLAALFQDAVGVPQGTLTAAFLQTAATRKKAFDTLLQVEEYKEAADRLREPGRNLRDRIQEIDLSLTEVATRLERLPQLEIDLEERANKFAILQDKLSEEQTALAQVLSCIEEQIALQSQIRTAEDSKNQLRQQQISLEREHASASAALSEAEQSQSIVDQNLNAHDRYLEAQKELVVLTERQREQQLLERSLSQMRQTISLLSAEKQNHNKMLAEIVEAEQLVSSLEEQVRLQIELEELVRQKEHRQIQLQESAQTHSELQNRLARLEERRATMRQQLATLGQLTEERSQLQALVTQQQQALREFSHAMGQYQTEAETIKSHNQALSDEDSAICPMCQQTLTAGHRRELLERNSAKLDCLRQSFAARRKEEEEAKRTIHNYQQRMSQIEHELQLLPRENDLQSLQTEISNVNERLTVADQATSHLAEISLNLKELRQQLNEIGDPRQQSEFARQNAARRQSIEQSLKQVVDKLIAEQQKISEHENRLSSFERVDAALAANQQVIENFQSAHQLVLAHQQIASSLDERSRRLETLAHEVDKNRKEQDSVQRQLVELVKQFDAGKLNKAQTRADEIKAHIASLQTQSSILQQEQLRLQAEIEALQKLHSEQEKTLAERNALTAQSDALETIRSYLRQAGPFITRTLIQQVSSGAEQIFGDLLQDYSRILSWDDDYGISLEVNGRQRQFAQLSGGEQMSAALSVRLALLREMSNIDVAFFDEPTTNLDATRRESLARQILDVKGFNQLFVISHDDTFEQTTDNVIRLGTNQTTEV